MKKKQQSQTSVVGGSSLMVIFSVLCVVIFALMSLTSATGDTRLNERSMEAVRGYFDADSEAEEILASLRQGIVPEGVRLEDGIYCYACPISETQVLQVEVMTDGTEYQILRWQAASAEEWTPDEHITVWDGTFPD